MLLLLLRVFSLSSTGASSEFNLREEGHAEERRKRVLILGRIWIIGPRVKVIPEACVLLVGDDDDDDGIRARIKAQNVGETMGTTTRSLTHTSVDGFYWCYT